MHKLRFLFHTKFLRFYYETKACDIEHTARDLLRAKGRELGMKGYNSRIFLDKIKEMRDTQLDKVRIELFCLKGQKA